MLGASADPLAMTYDLAMLDLDGVVYIGDGVVPSAPDALAAARAAGMRLAFITNNAARPPAVVADHLVELGIPASADDVVTSAQAAARLLADRLGAGARVVDLGAEGLHQALVGQQLIPVGVEDEGDALVTGYAPEVRWREIMRAAGRVRDGLWWVASNTDMTFPTAYGTAPGHGVLVDMIRRFAGVEPVVAGKPARPLLDETMRRVGGERPLMVGDRLDTDIAGAHNADVPSLLVMTGVTGIPELVSATPELRPTYIAPDLAGLLDPHPAPREEAGRVVLGGWAAQVRDGRLEIDGSGEVADWWRVLAVAAWKHLDAADAPVDASGLAAPQPVSPPTGR